VGEEGVRDCASGRNQTSDEKTVGTIAEHDFSLLTWWSKECNIVAFLPVSCDY
jgi:hypothetical protein